MRLIGAAGCSNSVHHCSQPGMPKPVKGGYLLRYKRRLFGKAWREEWVTLFEDSTIAWFKEKDRFEPEGCILIREAPEMMAVGQWTLRVPGRPELPSGCYIVQLMAFGNKRRDKVHWLLAKSEEEVNDWMTAISNTLPPPPQPLKPPDDKTTPSSDPVNPRLPPVTYYNGVQGDPLPKYSNVTHSNSHPGAIYPEAPYIQSTNTTILVRERSSNALGDLTAGVLMGATLSNWGHGWGWSNSFGCGANYYNQDHAEISINHHFEMNHSTGNHHDTHHCSYDYGDLEFGDGDYGMDCSGDFSF